MEEGEIGSPPRLSAHDKDDTVERCSEVNRPAALLKLGLRRLCAYPPPYGSSGTGNDSRFLALPAGFRPPCGVKPYFCLSDGLHCGGYSTRCELVLGFSLGRLEEELAVPSTEVRVPLT